MRTFSLTVGVACLFVGGIILLVSNRTRVPEVECPQGYVKVQGWHKETLRYPACIAGFWLENK